jgi:hypothetical protein
MSTYKELDEKIAGLKNIYKKNLGLSEHARYAFDFFANEELENKDKIIKKYDKLSKNREFKNLFNTRKEFIEHIEGLKNDELEELIEKYDIEVRPYEEKMDQLDVKFKKYEEKMIDLKEKIKKVLEDIYLLYYLVFIKRKISTIWTISVCFVRKNIMISIRPMLK